MQSATSRAIAPAYNQRSKRAVCKGEMEELFADGWCGNQVAWVFPRIPGRPLKFPSPLGAFALPDTHNGNQDRSTSAEWEEVSTPPPRCDDPIVRSFACGYKYIFEMFIFVNSKYGNTRNLRKNSSLWISVIVRMGVFESFVWIHNYQSHAKTLFVSKSKNKIVTRSFKLRLIISGGARL